MAKTNESPYKGSAQITREQFLFYEMRTTAKLMREGLNDDEIIDRIVEDNLFQYPTEKSIRQMAKFFLLKIYSRDMCGIGYPERIDFCLERYF